MTSAEKYYFFEKLIKDLLTKEDWKLERTQVIAASYFSSMAWACDIWVDTGECDSLIRKFYNECEMENDTNYEDFENQLICELL